MDVRAAAAAANAAKSVHSTKKPAAAAASAASASARRSKQLAAAVKRVATLLGTVLVTVVCHTLWAGMAAASGGGSFSLPTALPTLNPACDYREVSSQLLSASGALLALAFFSLSETAITTLWPWKVRACAPPATTRARVFSTPVPPSRRPSAKCRRPDPCRSSLSACCCCCAGHGRASYAFGGVASAL